MIPLEAVNVLPRVNHWTPDASANMVALLDRSTPENAPTSTPAIPSMKVSYFLLGQDGWSRVNVKGKSQLTMDNKRKAYQRAHQPGEQDIGHRTDLL